MTAAELRSRLQQEASRMLSWQMDWEKTCDQFLAGDPQVEIKSIAVAWLSTRALTFSVLIPFAAATLMMLVPTR